MTEASYTEALREALNRELAQDRDVILLGEDIADYGGAFGVTRGLLERFGPDRIINTPISEQGFTGVAIGASLVGSRPVVEIMFMDFAGLIIDQMVNQASKLHYVLGKQVSCPLVVRCAAGGGRRYGPTHSQTFTSWFMNTPGIKIATPATPADAYGLLRSAIKDDNPVLFVEHKMLYSVRGPVSFSSPPVPFGKASVTRKGTDLTIVAWSYQAHQALQAAAELDDLAISAEVIDLRTLNPMDTDAVVKSARKTRRVLIVEEGYPACGVAAEIAMRLSETTHKCLDAPVRRLTASDCPIAASSVLEDASLPCCSSIVDAAISLIEE